MIELLQTSEFSKWMRRLKDAKAKARIGLRLRRIELYENLGDYKSVGDGVFEIRINYGPGYRVYFAKRKNKIVLLLIGGDKSTQKRDIAKAKELNCEYD